LCLYCKLSGCHLDELDSRFEQSDNYWLNTRTPALTYGLRGLNYFKLTVRGPAADLHSGVFGRTVHEPMTDLIHLMSKLVDPQGNILVPGVEEMVPPPDEEEKLVQIDIKVLCRRFTAMIGRSTKS
jgi:acetylornithine deacetylase/succinyl-diaminopimelate desuccinylase-like protein